MTVRGRPLCVRAKQLNRVSINRKKLPQNPAIVFLKHIVRNRPNPDCSLYLAVSISQNDTVVELLWRNVSGRGGMSQEEEEFPSTKATQYVVP